MNEWPKELTQERFEHWLRDAAHRTPDRTVRYMDNCGCLLHAALADVVGLKEHSIGGTTWTWRNGADWRSDIPLPAWARVASRTLWSSGHDAKVRLADVWLVYAKEHNLDPALTTAAPECEDAEPFCEFTGPMPSRPLAATEGGAS